MKAVVYHRFGPPEVLEVVDTPEPDPGTGQIKLRVHATSVNPVDVVFRSGRIKGRLYSGVLRPRHMLLGSDMAGDVVAVGPGVDTKRVGDRVVGITPGMTLGAYAEYMCVEDNAVATIPAEIAYTEAAAFSFAGLSSLLFLRKIGGLDPGTRVMVVGASGGFGTFAVQLARHYGAEVTGVCSTRNVDLVASLGAHEVIDYTKVDPAAVRGSYDVVFDAAGVGSFGGYRHTVRPGGVYSTTVITPRVLGAMAINPLRRPRRRAHTMLVSGDPRAGLATLRDLVLEGSLCSVIERELPLEQVAEAHRRFEAGHTRGKIVLTV